MAQPSSSADLSFLAGGGEMGALIRAHDWAKSPLGPPAAWPQALRTTLGLLLNTGHPMYIWWGPELICFYNDAYRRSIGAERHPSSLGQPGRAIWGEIWDIIGPQIDQVMSGGGSTWHENALVPITRDGKREQVYWTYSYSPINDDTAANGVGGVLVVCSETTPQVMERARFAALFEQAPSFMAMLTGPDHRFELCNPAYMRVVGNRDILGKTLAEALPDAAAQGYLALLDNVYRTGEVYRSNGARYAVEPVAGGAVDLRYVDFVYQPIVDATGQVSGIFVEGFDVTDRMTEIVQRQALIELSQCISEIEDTAELSHAACEIVGRALQVSRVGYGTINKSDETIFIERDWNADGVPSLAGTLHFRDYGSYIADLVEGRTVVVPDARLDARTAANADALIGIYAHSFINMPVTESGNFVALFYLNHATARAWSDEELVFVKEVAQRVRVAVERRRNEQDLRVNIERVQLALAAGAIIGTWFWDLTTDRFSIDEAFARSFGIDPALGRSGLSLAQVVATVHPDDQEALAAAIDDAIARGGAYAHQYRVRRADGRYYWIEANGRVERGPDGAPTKFPGVLIDVEDRRAVEAERDRATAALRALNDELEARVSARTAELLQAEEALRQAQKMEAVGQLTGGLAHDFNNLLQGIAGSLQRIQKRIGEGRLGDAERFVKIATEATNRASALTHRLLAFSRRQTLDPRPTDINRLVGNMHELISRTVGPDVKVEVVGAIGLWVTKIDASQLENALLNLCINARDAMPNGGNLTIETANKWLDEREAKERELSPGQYLSLCVTDSGVGMPPDVIARAFDPFFTTKPIGQGTGLGLSMVYGFVRQSGGQVRVYSEIGHGTTMCLYLPRYIGAADADPVGAPAEPALTGSGETVLVVDDEATIRMLLTEVLGEAGYKIIEASDGASALKVLQSDARIDLLITDVGLPGGMNGRQIADAARTIRAGLKVIFITGFAENAVIGNGHLDSGMEILTKPFDMDVVINKVHDLLDS